MNQLASTEYEQSRYPYDNTPTERYFNILRNELINLHYYHNNEELNTIIEDFVYTWCNHIRPHAFNDYQTPYKARYAA